MLSEPRAEFRQKNFRPSPINHTDPYINRAGFQNLQTTGSVEVVRQERHAAATFTVPCQRGDRTVTPKAPASLSGSLGASARGWRLSAFGGPSSATTAGWWRASLKATVRTTLVHSFDQLRGMPHPEGQETPRQLLRPRTGFDARRLSRVAQSRRVSTSGYKCRPGGRIFSGAIRAPSSVKVPRAYPVGFRRLCAAPPNRGQLEACVQGPQRRRARFEIGKPATSSVMEEPPTHKAP